MEIVHLYAGPSYHMEGYIVASRQGLEKLRDAINKVLEGNNFAVTEVFTSDGEGYDLFVIKHDTSWDDVALPYTEYYQNNQAKWPYQLLKELP
jgi:hypothetical protein